MRIPNVYYRSVNQSIREGLRKSRSLIAAFCFVLPVFSGCTFYRQRCVDIDELRVCDQPEARFQGKDCAEDKECKIRGALDVARKLCDAGRHVYCSQYSWLLASFRDPLDAVPYLERGCYEHEQVVDCANYAAIANVNMNDQASAVRHLDKACQLGSIDACSNLVRYRENPDGGGAEQLQEYIGYCDRAHGRSCTHAADLFSEQGNVEMSEQYYRKACNLQVADGCADLAIVMSKQAGGRTETTEELVEKAISLMGNSYFVYGTVGYYYLQNEDYDRAEMYLRRILDIEAHESDQRQRRVRNYAYCMLSFVAEKQNRPEEAEQFHAKCDWELYEEG